jgi:alpha-glucosidase/alpha-D-xyloside xylohydrolase
MAREIPRRAALKQIGLAGAGVMLSGGVFRGQSAPITIAGRPVEIAIASVTPSTVRITVLPIAGPPLADDGAVVTGGAGRPAGRAPAWLLPYTYTAAKETTETGLPMIRALWLHYPNDPAAVARGDQFLWGRDLLVSPVVEKGATSRRLYLPRGTWFDFWTDARLEGGREINREVDLETMPLHVRAGTVLPLAPVRQYVDQAVDEPLTLVVYPGADGSASVYEDDGRSFDYRKGDAMRIAMAWRDRDRRLTLRLAPGTRMRPPEERRIRVRVAGAAAVRDVVFRGRPLEVTL